MARFVKGDVIVGWFPFSNATQFKKRPALVLATLNSPASTSADYLMCIISTQNVNDGLSFQLSASDVSLSGLNRPSFVRPGYLFTGDGAAIDRKIGILDSATVHRVSEAIKKLIG